MLFNTRHSYNIVDEVSERIQGMSWMTSKEYITIKYTIIWAYKGWLKMMQLATSIISATYVNQSFINHKDVSKPEKKPCKHKIY